MSNEHLEQYKSLDHIIVPQRSWQLTQRGVGMDNVFLEPQYVPHIPDNGLLLRVDASVICTSDVKNIWSPQARDRIVGHTGKSGYDIEGSGVVNGHEAALTVVGVGNDIKTYQKGDRVILQADLREFDDGQAVGYRVPGAFRGFCLWGPVVHDKYLIKLEKDIGYAEAALIEGPTCVYASHQVGPVRDTDKVMWINGVGGPMGTMHTEEILLRRKIGKYQGIQTLIVSDIDSGRLESYYKRFGPRFEEANIRLVTFNPRDFSGQVGLPPIDPLKGVLADYYLELGPSADITLANLVSLRNGAIINIYSSYSHGTGDVVLRDGTDTTLKAIHTQNRTVEGTIGTVVGRPFTFTGNSGSTVEDMRTVLARLQNGDIETYHFASAVTGYDMIEDAIHAQHDRRFPGKIVIFNQVRNLPLTAICDLHDLVTDDESVHADIDAGRLTRRIEDALLSRWLDPAAE